MRFNVVSREIFNDEHRKASWSNGRKDQVWTLESRDSSTREVVIVQVEQGVRKWTSKEGRLAARHGLPMQGLASRTRKQAQ